MDYEEIINLGMYLIDEQIDLIVSAVDNLID